MGHHHKKHVHSGTFLLLHLIALVLLAVSVGFFNKMFWYKVTLINGAGVMHYGGKTSCFDLASSTTCHDTKDFKEKVGSHASEIVLDSYYLVITGLACSGFVIIAIMLQFILKKCLAKVFKRLLGMLAIAFSVFAVVADFLAFGLFFRITNAFHDDATYCAIGWGKKNPCTEFSGKTDLSKWGPDDGFWLCLAGGIFAAIAFFLSLRSGGKHHKYSSLR